MYFRVVSLKGDTVYGTINAVCRPDHCAHLLLQVLQRTLRVDHVENYKVPKETGDEDEVTQRLRTEGCAPITATRSKQEEEKIAGKLKKGR